MVFNHPIEFATAFFACQLAGLIAVPVPTTDHRGTGPSRLRAFAENSGAAAILTGRSLYESVQAAVPDAMVFTSSSILPGDRDPAELPGLSAPACSIAYLQYTSGSTGQPKGVCVSHANVLSNLRQIAQRLRLPARTSIVSWLPYYHDQGLVGSLLLTLQVGGTCHLMNPAAFAQRPLRWLEAISRYRAYLSGGPNFAYDLCVQAAQRATHSLDIDLSNWHVAYNGAEPVRLATLSRFAAQFAPQGFGLSQLFPSYGLAEATLAVTMPDPSAVDRWRSVADGAGSVIDCGTAMPGTEILIVDPETDRPLPEGERGAIWVRGPSVACGYWRDATRSDRTFGAVPPGSPADRRYLRTGDIGFLREGRLFVLARQDDMFIVRGRNHYPADIEATIAACHPFIKTSDVVLFHGGTDEAPCVAIEMNPVLSRERTFDNLAARLRETVAADHGIVLGTVHLLPKGKLPRTTSGKIRRKECARLIGSGQLPALVTFFSASTDAGISPETTGPLAEKLRYVLSTLGLLAERSTGEAPDCIWDSLDIIRVQHAVEQAFGVHLALSELALPITIAGLADALRETATTNTIDEATDAADNRLTELQQEIWLAEQVAPAGFEMAIGCVIELDRSFDVGALSDALGRLAARHWRLNTRVALDETGSPCHLPLDRAAAADALSASSVTAAADPAAKEWSAIAIDVTAGPLLRVAHQPIPTGTRILLRAHHLIADHQSIHRIARELSEPEIESSATVGSDEFARWHRTELAQFGGRLSAFWRTALDGFTAAAPLLTGLPRRPLNTVATVREHRKLPTAATAAIARRATEKATGVNALVLTAFALIAARLMDSRDVVIGCPTALRGRRSDAETIGYLVNTLPIRIDLVPEGSLEDVWRETQRRLMQAMRHGAYPFVRIANLVEWPRDDVVSPLCQLMFNVLDRRAEVAMPPRARMLLHPQHPLSELQLILLRDGDHIELEFTALAERYDTNFLRELMDGLIDLIESFADSLHRQTRSIDVTTAEQRACLTGPFRELPLPMADDRIERRVAAAAGRTPHHPALRWRAAGGGWETLSYGDLAARMRDGAEQLAGHCGGVVGVMMPRSHHRIVVILSILAAGAAYLPLDRGQPIERLRHMIDVSGCDLVVTDTAQSATQIANVVNTWIPGEALPKNIPVRAPNPVAAIIFTSGSTGEAKGVAVPHEAYLNRLAAMACELAVRSGDVFLQKTPLSFDVSVWEIFLPLLEGACLVLPTEDDVRNPAALTDLMQEASVSIVHFVPSLLAEWLDSQQAAPRLPALRACLCSGEPLTARHRDTARRLLEEVSLINLYGPTECGIDVVATDCLGDDGEPPIGLPTANIAVKILDRELRLLPPGAAGQLAIAGPQLAFGYVGRPGLTAERFVPDPEGRGGRIYLTGDRARWGADRQLHYLGRMDRQVKIFGVRVELDEVAACLRRHPDVADAEALLIETSGSPQLAAVVKSERDLSEQALAEFLATLLPPVMIPAIIRSRRDFPVTPNGKRDLNALLAEFGRDAGVTGPPVSPPPHETHALLRAAWRRTLAAEVDLDVDFFTVGGDSIKAIRLAAALRESGLLLSLAEIYAAPTIRLQAQRLASRSHGAVEPESYQPFCLLTGAAAHDIHQMALEDAYPLSMIQRSIVFESEHNPCYEVYGSHIRIAARFDAAALQSAIEALLERHPFLRSSFDLAVAGQPLQLIHRRVDAPIETFDWRGIAPSELDDKLDAWRRQERSRPFRWDEPPLIRFAVHRLSDIEFELHVSEAALDGWCVATMLTEIAEDYDARLTRQMVPRGPPPPSYGHFVALEQRALKSETTRRFWSDQLRGTLATCINRWPAAALRGGGLKRREIVLDRDSIDGLVALASAEQASMKTLLLAIHVACLAALSPSRRVVAPIEVNGRPEIRGGDETIGAFNNIVPLVIDTAGLSWRDLIRTLREAEAKMMPHRRYPYSEILKQSGGRYLGDALFVFTEFHVLERLGHLSGLDVTGIGATDQTYFPLTIHFHRANPDGLRLLLDFQGSDFTEQQVDFVARCLTGLVEALPASIVTNCTAAIERLRTEAIAAFWDATGGSLRDRILTAATRHPDLTAIRQDQRVISYRDLQAAVRVRADAFAAGGCLPGTRIALAGPAEIDLVVAILAAWHVGAACLLIDPDDMPSRMLAALDQSEIRVLFGDLAAPTLRALESAGIGVHPLSAGESPRCDSTPALLHQSQPAYLLCTSGSTGQPKTVIVSHAAVSNYALWAARQYDIKPRDRVWNHSSVGFDFTFTTLLAPLACGATVECVAKGDLAAVLTRIEPADVLKLTPSHLAAIMAQADSMNLEPRLPGRVIMGGEQLYGGDIALMRAINRSVHIFNEYGPTEATIGCTCHECEDIDGTSPCSIGTPADNVQIHVLSDELVSVAPGRIGHLHIAGAGLAEGYCGLPDVTARSFLPDPFAAIPGARMYRSGDAASRECDGRLICRGRLDRQLKRFGYRIELEEVEHALKRIPGITAAAVTSQGERLAAWIAGASSHDGPHIQHWLDRLLPWHMHPAVITPLAAMPLTPNGKIDYVALSVSDRAAPPAVATEDDLLAFVDGLSAVEAASMLEQLLSGADHG